MKKSNRKHSTQEMLSIIENECEVIFSNKQEINKLFVSIRVATETALKIIVSIAHPKIKVENKMLHNLIPLLYDVDEFDMSHMGFIRDAKKYGNHEGHANLKIGDMGIARIQKLGLNRFLKWFYEDYMHLRFPNLLFDWYNREILEKDISIEKQSEENINQLNPEPQTINYKESKKEPANELNSSDNKGEKKSSLKIDSITINGLNYTEKTETIKNENIQIKFERNYFNSTGNKKNEFASEKNKNDIRGANLLPLRHTLIIKTSIHVNVGMGKSAEKLLSDYPQLYASICKTIESWSADLLKTFKGIDVININMKGYYLSDYFYDDKDSYTGSYNLENLRKEAVKFIIVQFLRDKLNEIFESKGHSKYDNIIYYEKFLQTVIERDKKSQILSAIADPMELFWWRLTNQYGLSLFRSINKPFGFGSYEKSKYKKSDIIIKIGQLNYTIDGWINKFERKMKVKDLRDLV